LAAVLKQRFPTCAILLGGFPAFPRPALPMEDALVPEAGHVVPSRRREARPGFLGVAFRRSS
jgi:hypothetical protein